MNREPEHTLGRKLEPWENAILQAGNLALVGGVVRDLLRGEKLRPLDVDYIASAIAQDKLIAILNNFGKTNLTGKSFGVIKFQTPAGHTVDISLPRCEFSTGPGHRDFQVEFDPGIPLEEDLLRRDYTINSMALDLRTLKLIDPLGGKEDLNNRLLRVNRENSFREDPLRILRGVQFMARFGLRVEEKTRELMGRDGELLQTVSPERIRDELNKMMLLADKPGDGFIFMHHTGILREILPELDETWGVEQNEFHPDDIFIHSVKSCDGAGADLLLRWSALLHDLGKKKMKQTVKGKTVFYRHEVESAELSRRILKRLSFSNLFIRQTSHLVENHMFFITGEWSDGAVRRFMARVGVESLEPLLALRMADGKSRGDQRIAEEVKNIRERFTRVLENDAALKRNDLPVNGRDVMEITGLGPGPRIGSILDGLLEMVLDNPERNTRPLLLEEIHRIKDGGSGGR
ncbi:MAG: HDIG domain-containing protein [Candidatus Krumholzibacteriota bacterium]|nr:HDIG domain-containing protein [Candidatus Krumholzibacteriota bacterium]